MKVAFFGVKCIPYTAGIDNFSYQVGKRLVEREHRVTIYVRKWYTHGLKRQWYYEGIEIVQTAGVHTKHLDAISHSITALLHALFHGVDIFYIHSVGLASLCLILRCMGRKSVLHVHGLDWERQKWNWLAQRILRTFGTVGIKAASTVVSVSNTDGLRLKNELRLKQQPLWVPTGVMPIEESQENLLSTFGLQPQDYILFVGRLVPEKGCHLLLETFRNIDTQKRLVIVGGSSHSDKYVRSLHALANERVVFTDFQGGDHLRALFKNAYCFVQPSFMEGLPHTVLQAMSAGTCVIASDIPGNREALGDTGIYFPSGDFHALRKKIFFLLAEPESRREFVSRAYHRAITQFSWDRIVDMIESNLARTLTTGGIYAQ